MSAFLDALGAAEARNAALRASKADLARKAAVAVREVQAEVEGLAAAALSLRGGGASASANFDSKNEGGGLA